MWENFYEITDQKQKEEGFEARIRLNPEHLIYKAHFPDNPVTPGVCILQICQELVAAYFHKPLRMVRAKNIKFLNVLRPAENREVIFKIGCYEGAEGIEASIIISDKEKVFAKISAVYKG